jgi:hypothetical protein
LSFPSPFAFSPFRAFAFSIIGPFRPAILLG